MQQAVKRDSNSYYTMTDSPVTPTTTTVSPRSSVPRSTFERRAAIKHQENGNGKGNGVPSLTAAQVASCQEALKLLRQKMRGAGGGIDREFDALEVERMRNFQAPCKTTVAQQGINRGRNRYLNVLPYDNTRVVLETTGLGPNASDYINANYIQGDVNEGLPRYIATQGPLRSTIGEFWTMVLQQQCPAIVMLTRVIDVDQDKCAPYFPEKPQQSKTYGQIRVTNKSISYNHSIAKRVYDVENIKSGEPPLTVVHYEYRDWPDFYVPPCTQPIRELVRALHSIPPNAGPIVVHCSAGIGRTGTYCTIDHTVRRILAGDLMAVDIDNTLRQFRLQREGLVQTREQYHFCYKAVVEELEDYISSQYRATKSPG